MNGGDTRSVRSGVQPSSTRTSTTAGGSTPAAHARSFKGSLASLHNLDRRAMMANSSGSLLNEWNYVLAQASNSSGAPSLADRASVSGFSYATKKTGKTNAFREPTFQGVFRPKFIKRETSEVYCVKFSPDDEYIAAGLGSAQIQIYSTNTNEMMRTLTAPTESGQDIFPCTTVTFRPDSQSFRNRNIMAAGFADGRIIHWHYTSGQLISTINEPDTQVNCVTYQNVKGQCDYFASASSDSFVRVYDSENHKRILEMNRGQGEIAAGHSSRVFSVRFHPTEKNVLVSGGWDNTIQFWDTRIGHSVRSIYGPHICGTDALDFSPDGTQILSASFAKSDQLQIFDYGTGSVMETIPWSLVDGERKTAQLYSGVFGPRTGSHVLAGGSGAYNEVKMFNTTTRRAVGVAGGFAHSVYSVGMSENERMVAVGGGFRGVYVYDVDMGWAGGGGVGGVGGTELVY